MAKAPTLTRIRDGFVNLVNSLGTQKDPRMATAYGLTPLDPGQLLMAYRGNWLARRIVDSLADDATREWRNWHATDEQIQALEDFEKKIGLQAKTRAGLVRARLFGGGALVMGVDGAGAPDEPLDLDRVRQDALKFVVVMSCNEISRGQLITDVTSPWFARPEHYQISGSRATLATGSDGVTVTTKIHPSRVVEFIGADIPDWNSVSGSICGDSVLQVVDDVLKDYGVTLASVAAMVNDGKVDVFTIPGLTKMISNSDYEGKLRTRLTVSNRMKSTINAMLMDENEKWARTQTNYAGLPDLMSEFLKVVAGAAGIPLTRLVGHGSGSGTSTLGGGKSGGESDLRNYYDEVASRQKNEIGPQMAILDEVLMRSALGAADEKIYYEWAPLYRPDPAEQAAIAVQKSNVYKVDVETGLINPDVLREARLNQLVEDGFYPGLEGAIEEHGAEPEEPDVTPDDVAAHLGLLEKSSAQLSLPAPKKPVVAGDGARLRHLGMLK